MKQVRHYTMAADGALLAGLRDALRRQLDRWQVDPRAALRFTLVVDEIFNNAIEHGQGDRADETRLELEVMLQGGDLQLAFADPDVSAEVFADVDRRLAEATVCPPLDAERGRGLFLIRDTLDHVTIDWSASRGLSLVGVLRGVRA